MDVGTPERSAAERRLLEAVEAGHVCDFSEGQVATPGKKPDWGQDRSLSAEFLREVLLASARDPLRSIRVRGAVIVGVLDVHGERLASCALEDCRLDGYASFEDATFVGDASFSGTMFRRGAAFDGATFTNHADFGHATFGDQASFSSVAFKREAGFGRTTFDGEALFGGAMFTQSARFGHAIFSQDARFGGSIFTSNAWFDGGTFKDAWFGGADFRGHASFDGAAFAGRAQFASTSFKGDARFARGTFTESVLFDSTSFLSGARFDGATFGGRSGFETATFVGAAYFDSATFGAEAEFSDATFTADASFAEVNFMAYARFRSATFAGDAHFNGATFTGHARFYLAAINGDASFGGATFFGEASFDGAAAATYDLTEADFHRPDPGPWVAHQVTLAKATMRARSRVGIAASTVDARGLQAREGIHLQIRSYSVDLSDAEFLRRSILAHSEPEPDAVGAQRQALSAASVTRSGLSDAWVEEQRCVAQGKARRLRDRIGHELSSSTCTRTGVRSLQRAVVSDLVLSGVGLERCAFAGAHGLDRMRIDATCTFAAPSDWSMPTRWMATRRRMLFEEVAWRRRQSRTGRWSFAALVSDPGAVSADSAIAVDPRAPEPLEIAGLYRDLRKGLEDAKDEPGAADFYYGEMEMRRASAETSGVERRLLFLYWVVSGYGLRAWRALTSLAVVITICAGLFTLPAFAHAPTPVPRVDSLDLQTGRLRYAPPVPESRPTPPDPVSFSRAMEFTVRESLTITRAAGPPAVETTGAGTAVHLALRLLAPLLVGLAVLAIRGRAKR